VQDEEIHLPDGRVTLTDPERVCDSRYTNGDLAPVPIKRRTWNTYNYAALWIGMSHNIPSYLLASGLIAVGFNWVQAIFLFGAGERHRAHPDAAEQPRGHEVRDPVPGETAHLISL
jgi:cytosine/uracil/thiamine/allantoin permease